VSLDELVAAHQDAIAGALREAIPLWKPYVPFGAPPENAGAAWQTSSLATLPAAQAFDHLTARLLAAGGNDNLSVAEALRQLAETYRRLP
jgi:hypothetical protein